MSNSTNHKCDVLTDEDFDHLMNNTVKYLRRDIIPAIEQYLYNKIHKELKIQLKDDVTRIILAARNVRMDNFTSTLSPNTSVKSISEWRHNKVIHEFLEEVEMKKLEDIYIRGISDEMARASLINREGNENYLIFVNALKIRGYSLRVELRTLSENP